MDAYYSEPVPFSVGVSSLRGGGSGMLLLRLFEISRDDFGIGHLLCSRRWIPIGRVSCQHGTRRVVGLQFRRYHLLLCST